MSDEEDRKTADGADADRKPKPSAARGERDVGHALRSVYTATVAEEIPADLLALLGKLD